MKKLVIIPGGFHPFHAGHKALYDAAREAFPSADVFVAATDDRNARPFPFAVKQKLAQLAGIPKHRFIQVKSPFRAQEITQNYDPDTTQLIFVRSDKDKDQNPKAGGTRQDGTPAYLQPYKRRGLEPMSKQGYMTYLPTVIFGSGMTSATEIRTKWPQMTDKQRGRLVNVLYPRTAGNEKLTDVTVQMLDQVMGTATTEGLGGAIAGGIAGAVIGRSPGAAMKGAQAGSAVQNAFKEQEVDETVLVNNPQKGIEIRPEGGMGTWDEDSLKMSLARQLSDLVNQLKTGNYTNIEHLLYKNGAMNSKVKALADMQRFYEKQGKRPIARGREIEIGESVNAPGASAAKAGADALAAIERIVDKKQSEKVKLLDGAVLIDLYTASAIKQIYDAVKDENKQKILNTIGTQAGIRKIADFAMKQINESSTDEEALTEAQFDEAAGEKDACYHKVKSRYKVWPSAYASGALVKCRKVGAANWGNKSKK